MIWWSNLNQPLSVIRKFFLVTLQNWLICIIRWFYTLYVKKFEICNCMSDLHLPNWQQILVSKFHGDLTGQISVLRNYFGRGVVKMDYLKKSSNANYFNWIRFYLLCIWTQIWIWRQKDCERAYIARMLTCFSQVLLISTSWETLQRREKHVSTPAMLA